MLIRYLVRNSWRKINKSLSSPFLYNNASLIYGSATMIEPLCSSPLFRHAWTQIGRGIYLNFCEDPIKYSLWRRLHIYRWRNPLWLEFRQTLRCLQIGIATIKVMGRSTHDPSDDKEMLGWTMYYETASMQSVWPNSHFTAISVYLSYWTMIMWWNAESSAAVKASDCLPKRASGQTPQLLKRYSAHKT